MSDLVVITKLCTFISGSIFKPYDGGYGPNYFVTVCIPNSDEETLYNLKHTLFEAFSRRYGKAKQPKDIKCLKDGNRALEELSINKPESIPYLQDYYKNAQVLIASTGISHPPVITNSKYEELTFEDNGRGYDTRFSAGASCRLCVTAYAGDRAGKNSLTGEKTITGVSLKFTLNHIMLIEAGKNIIKGSILIPKDLPLNKSHILSSIAPVNTTLLTEDKPQIINEDENEEKTPWD